MDALGGESVRVGDRVEQARTAIARAITKANLTGDPMAPALQAISESLGAQLALHQASAGHFRDVSDRLDRSVAEAILRGEQALEARRMGIVESLAPELARLTTKNVETWKRTITLRAATGFGGFAVALAFGVALAAYGAGWEAGRNTALNNAGVLAAAIRQAGPAAENSLVDMVRANNVNEAWAKCLKSAVADRTGRKVCAMPMWAEPGLQPSRD